VALRIAHGVMTLLLAYATFVNFNDPDAPRWVAMYGAATIVTALAALRPAALAWWVPGAVGVIAAVWAATIAPRVLGHVRFGELWQQYEMKNALIEEGREFYGLCIVAGWMAVTLLGRLLAKP
jgi:hypothetical protein